LFAIDPTITPSLAKIAQTQSTTETIEGATKINRNNSTSLQFGSFSCSLIINLKYPLLGIFLMVVQLPLIMLKLPRLRRTRFFKDNTVSLFDSSRVYRIHFDSTGSS
jgi:hypothetical protein